MSNSPDKIDTKREQEAIGSNWPKTEMLPEGDRFVLLAFHGLMGFAYNQERGHCEIGIHSKAPRHEFKMMVYEFSAGAKPKEIWNHEFGTAGYLPKDVVRLEVDNPTEAGVKFYMPAYSGNETGGVAAARDDYDFRRVPDFEGPDFYNRRLTKKRGAFNPVITINSGTFLTLCQTKKFKLVVPNNTEANPETVPETKPLGNLAWLIGNLISLEEGGSVTLSFNAEGLPPLPPLSPDTGKSYFILFDNSCHKDVCDYKPESGQKEERNDFYLYYETFEIPAGEKEYELHLDEAETDTSPHVHSPDSEGKGKLMAVSNLAPFLRELAGILSNDRAPCGGAGYGQSGGLDG